MTNPYLNRTAIRSDESFVGRTSELRRLYNRIGGGQPQSVSIVGDRRIGKSSLLRALMARRDKFLTRADSYVFVYMDMQSRLRWTPEMFFERLAAEMAPATGIDASSITDYDSLERWCRSLQSNSRVLVLLIDEFHVLMKDDPSGNHLPVEFFNYLRSLANSYAVSLVVTSHVDLYTLSEDHRLSGSPLFNILHKLHLGPFTEVEARELIEMPSGRAGCVLEQDADWIISRGGYHPLYLQIACSAAFDWRTENGPQNPLNTELLNRRFMEEARPHFEGTWKLFTPAERQIMSAAVSGNTAGMVPVPAVEGLVARGYLRQRDGRLAAFSDAFRAFIVEQNPAEHAASVTPSPVEPPAAAQARVFISYAREDQEDVRNMYRRLKDSGLDPWMDDENLIGGDTWARAIDDAIQSADFFIACLSTRSVDKSGVLTQELSKGLNQWYARSGQDNYLLPVMLEECEMPKSLAALQRVDWWKEDGWTRLRTSLKTAIERRKTLASPVEQPPRFTASVVSLVTTTERIGAWLKRRALLLGLSLMFIGVLLLIGGLSGEALSRLIGMVGLQRARNWNVVLRALEAFALVSGALLVSVALFRQRHKPMRIALCALLGLATWLLIRVDVPAPAAFALAYDHYLVDRSDGWRQRLLTFIDPATGGVRDASDATTLQAWTTAQGIVGVLGNVGYDGSKLSELERNQIRGAVNYLETVRMAAPEDGWGYFADRPVAITEITAWVAIAEIASVRANLWNPGERDTIIAKIGRELKTIIARQTPSGGWSPVLDVRDDNTRTYSTVMALWALAAGFREGMRTDASVVSAVRGMDWLLNERHAQLGWVPNPRRRYQTEEFPGLTAQALLVLAFLEQQLPDRRGDVRFRDAKQKFVQTRLSGAAINGNARIPDSDVHVALGNSSTTLEGSTFLWYPWSRAALALLANDSDLASDARARALRESAALTLRTEELSSYLDEALPYALAEHLLCIRIASDGTVR